jgi:putative flippase GtrA
MFLSKKLLLFFLNGILINSISYFFYFLFTSYLFFFNPVITAAIIGIIFIIINYFSQSKLVFKYKTSVLSLKKYIILVFFLYTINLVFLTILIYIFNINHLISQILCIGLVFLISFFFSNNVVYKD